MVSTSHKRASCGSRHKVVVRIKGVLGEAVGRIPYFGHPVEQVVGEARGAVQAVDDEDPQLRSWEFPVQDKQK